MIQLIIETIYFNTGIRWLMVLYYCTFFFYQRDVYYYTYTYSVLKVFDFKSISCSLGFEKLVCMYIYHVD